MRFSGRVASLMSTFSKPNALYTTFKNLMNFSISAGTCLRVQNTWASSWQKVRTRESPCTTPPRS
jgi:hypothetical protein